MEHRIISDATTGRRPFHLIRVCREGRATNATYYTDHTDLADFTGYKDSGLSHAGLAGVTAEALSISAQRLDDVDA
jgi:hypothetical protein